MSNFSFLTASQVDAALESVGARFVKVTFMTKGGALRQYVGRNKTYSRRVDPLTASPESIRRAEIAAKSLADNGNVFLDFPKVKVDDKGRKKTGFAFNRGRVIAIGDTGTHPEIPEESATA